MRGVAADDLDEVAAEVERLEQPIGMVLRLVGENRQRVVIGQARQAVDDAGVGARMIGEAPLVDDAETRVGRVEIEAAAAGGEDARDEKARALADHADDLVVIERGRAQRREQLVGGFGDVTPRIDERAVEIEHQDTEQ